MLLLLENAVDVATPPELPSTVSNHPPVGRRELVSSLTRFYLFFSGPLAWPANNWPAITCTGVVMA